jgi:TonB family protein
VKSKRGYRCGVCGSLLYLASVAMGQQSAPPPSAEPPRQAVRVPIVVLLSQAASKALLLKKVEPDYPQAARETQVQGEVRLNIRINQEGNVTDAEFVSGPPPLVAAAIDAVKQWKYKPYPSGNPTEVATEAAVEFKLDASDSHFSDADPRSVTGVAGDNPGGTQERSRGLSKAVAPSRVRISQVVSKSLIGKGEIRRTLTTRDEPVFKARLF